MNQIQQFDLRRLIKLFVAVILCYLIGLMFKSIFSTYIWTLLGCFAGIILGLFILPFIADLLLSLIFIIRLILFRFLKRKSFIIDSSTILDGRIVEILKAGLIDRPIFVSSITFDELRKLQNESELYRSRVKRGFESIEIIRKIKKNNFRVISYSKNPKSIRGHIVNLAKTIGASIMTLDTDLTEMARKNNINVVNINELALAFRTQILPGEQFDVLLTKPGKESMQGVGYLEDGVMVVIEDGIKHLNKRIIAECTSILQSPSGRIIFGKFIKNV